MSFDCGSVHWEVFGVGERQELLECVSRVSDLVAEPSFRFVRVGGDAASGTRVAGFGRDRLERLL